VSTQILQITVIYTQFIMISFREVKEAELSSQAQRVSETFNFINTENTTSGASV